MSASCSPFASGPTERKIRLCSPSLRSTRCLIYEWVLRQRSLLKVAAPSVKGTVTPSMRRRESRTERWLTAVRAIHARTCWGYEKPHNWCSLTESVEWRLAVEKVGHTSCLWKWVSTFYACAVYTEVSTLSSVATATWMRQNVYIPKYECSCIYLGSLQTGRMCFGGQVCPLHANYTMLKGKMIVNIYT